MMPPTREGRLPLAGVTVLVTRPEQQATALCQHIEEAGGIAIRFPVLEIRPPSDLTAARQIVRQLDRFDLVVFVSGNAVTYGLELARETHGPLPAGLQVAAIGEGTARALENEGVHADLYPLGRANSEALLAMDALRKVRDKRVLIFRGEGGRETLADTLRQRGAEVEYAEVYRRAVPATDPGPLLEQWQRVGIDFVVATSTEGLQNLFLMLGPAGQYLARATRLVVFSKRTAQFARDAGVAKVLVAAETSDAGILDTLTNEVLGADKFR